MATTVSFKRKTYGIASITGISNLTKAFKSGQGLTAMQRVGEGLKGAGKMSAIGLGTTAVGAGVAGAKFAGDAKEALHGDMGKENGMGF